MSVLNMTIRDNRYTGLLTVSTATARVSGLVRAGGLRARALGLGCGLAGATPGVARLLLVCTCTCTASGPLHCGSRKGFLLTASSMQIMYANASFCELVGVSNEHLIKMRLHEVG